MKSANFVMLSFAIATIICLILIGISIAEKSIFGIILAIIAAIITMGLGFTTKKKLRESGKL
jgi:hypothetical protein